jgi:hypothetical protein
LLLLVDFAGLPVSVVDVTCMEDECAEIAGCVCVIRLVQGSFQGGISCSCCSIVGCLFLSQEGLLVIVPSLVVMRMFCFVGL